VIAADRLPLTPKHLAELRGSGLSDETIAASGVYSEHDPIKLGLLINGNWPKRLGTGLVFRYRELDGELNGYARVKPDSPRTFKNKPVKYESRRREPNRIYFPPGTVEHLQEPTTDLFITEGEKKALAAAQLGLCCIGLGGVDSWRVSKSADRLLPQLEAIEWRGRRVFIVFDSDRNQKDEIRDAESRLAVQLKQHGATVKVIGLPEGPNGDKVGLDDLLAAHGACARDEFHALLKQAQDPEPVNAGVIKAPAKLIDAYPEAERFLLKCYSVTESKTLLKTLLFHQGAFFRFGGAAYHPASEDDVRVAIKHFLHPNYFQLTISSTSNVLDCVKAISHVRSQLGLPTWIAGAEPFPAHEILVTKSGMVHLPSFVDGRDYLHPLTARFFSLNALDYSFVPEAGEPAEWLRFLSQLWPDDPQTIEALQEFFGYLLLPDTSQQKILLVIGPRRSGKGTIGRIIRALIGPDNIIGPTLSSIASPFGLASWRGKSAAIVSDARLSARQDMATVTERLLTISGEDAVQIDRKYAESVTDKLPTRIVIMTNEIPKLVDTSGALAGRMLVIRLTESFYGREDPGLTDRLIAELPGILRWSIEGWRRLRERGRFVQPEAGAEMLGELEDLTSSVGQFVRECCVVDGRAKVSRADIFAAWKLWCEAGNREPGGDGLFGRDLRAAVPTIRDTQPREDGERYRAYQGIGLLPET
jgi:putative DNA primase/helicase